MQGQDEPKSWRISLAKGISIFFLAPGFIYAFRFFLWEVLDFKSHPIDLGLSSIDWEMYFPSFFEELLRYSWIYLIFNVFYLGLAIGWLFSLEYYRTWWIMALSGIVCLTTGYLLYQDYFIPTLYCLALEVALSILLLNDLVWLKVRFIFTVVASKE